MCAGDGVSRFGAVASTQQSKVTSSSVRRLSRHYAALLTVLGLLVAVEVPDPFSCAVVIVDEASSSAAVPSEHYSRISPRTRPLPFHRVAHRLRSP